MVEMSRKKVRSQRVSLIPLPYILSRVIAKVIWMRP